jgi:hypothetical protein
VLRAFDDWDEQRDADRSDVLVVRLFDGRVLRRERLLLPGDDVPERWDGVWSEKVHQCTQSVLSLDATARLTSKMLALRSVGDLGDVARELGGD